MELVMYLKMYTYLSVIGLNFIFDLQVIFQRFLDI
jgi:hypothetical protein